MLPERSDAVVIGGGVMGAAALHYLVELGCERPVLVERDTLGSGSTGHCAGGVRTLFSDELNVRVALESIGRLERLLAAAERESRTLAVEVEAGREVDGQRQPGRERGRVLGEEHVSPLRRHGKVEPARRRKLARPDAGR